MNMYPDCKNDLNKEANCPSCSKKLDQEKAGFLISDLWLLLPVILYYFLCGFPLRVFEIEQIYANPTIVYLLFYGEFIFYHALLANIAFIVRNKIEKVVPLYVGLVVLTDIVVINTTFRSLLICSIMILLGWFLFMIKKHVKSIIMYYFIAGTFVLLARDILYIINYWSKNDSHMAVGTAIGTVMGILAFSFTAFYTEQFLGSKRNSNQDISR